MLNIDKKNIKNIITYCELNKIENIELFTNKCLKKGYDIEVYGLLGNNESNIIEKEVIKEIIREIPVEVIKIVEVVKEIPGPIKEIKIIEYVEKEVIKEIIVEVPVISVVKENLTTVEPEIRYLQDDVQIKKLQEIIKTIEIEKNDLLSKVSEPHNNIKLDKTKMLEATLHSLKKELNLKDNKIKDLENKLKQLEELVKLNKGAVFLKGSNITDNI